MLFGISVSATRRMQGRRESDEEIGFERRRDLLLQELADAAAAAGAPHDLAGEVAVRDRVIGSLLSRHPAGLLSCQRRTARVPVVEVLELRGLLERRQSRLVREHLRDGDVLLAVLRELGPHARDGVVVAQHAAVDEHGNANRDYALGRRVHVEQRVLAPRLRAASIHVSGPQVDDAALAMEHAERRADFATVIVALEVRREALADGLEAGRDRTGDSRQRIHLRAHRM